MKTTNTMKKMLTKGALGVAFLSSFASSALAIGLGDSGTGFNAKGAFGEYVFQPTSGPVSNIDYADVARNQGLANSFQTFCLEQPESVANGNVNYVVNDEAVIGGTNSGTPGDQGGDIISQGTAWLYSLFARGILTDYFTNPDRIVAAALLQQAIWALEDEDSAGAANPFYNSAVAQFGSVSEAKKSTPTGSYGVWVLNNTVNRANAQDMLYYAPDGGSTVMLLGLSLTGLSLLARSKRLARTA